MAARGLLDEGSLSSGLPYPDTSEPPRSVAHLAHLPVGTTRTPATNPTRNIYGPMARWARLWTTSRLKATEGARCFVVRCRLRCSVRSDSEQVGPWPRWAQALDCAGFCYQGPFVRPQDQRHEPTWPIAGGKVAGETVTSGRILWDGLRGGASRR